MITFLLKAGVPKEHAIMFVSNPLVREYAKQQRIIKGAYAKMTGKIDENFPETKTKYEAAVNALETVGIKKAGSLVSAKGYYKAAVDATSKSGILNDALEFDIKMMSKLVKNPNAPELKNHAVAMFLHFLELEKSTRGYTSLKFMSNPDTKTSKTLQEIIRRNLSIEDAKSMSTIEEGTVEKMMDSILGSFYDNKLIGDLIVPLFPLRNNDTVTNYIVKTIQLKQNIITRTFGRGHDGTRRFITEFKNAIPNYIYQNYKSNFIDENGNITSMPDNFEGFPVKEKAGVKNGAQIINGTLYIDKTRLSNEYSKKLYLRDNTDAAGYTKQGLRGFGNVEKLFPNESTYFKYVFERELQRNLYSMKSLETNKDYLKINSIIKDPAQSYEAYINQRALINAFNRETIMTLDGQSYTDMVLNMVEEFSELKNKYPILTQFTIPKVKTGERVLSLNDTKSLKDAQLAEIYFQNLEDLGNEDIKKVIDPEDNKRISKLFALLPQMMMYQHGIGYSKYGFTRALPYEGFIGVMQTASEIFINKQLNEDTLAVIFDKLVEPGNKVFKNLLVTPKQYLKPEPSVVKEEDEFMSEEEAVAMLEKMGIKPIGEESTQSSTSVNPAEFTNHSGGAYGGDTFWDMIGREFGVTKHMHYKDAGNANLSQKLRNAGIKATVLTKEQMDQARTEVERLLGQSYPDTLQGNLQVRNYYQVANADAVYAIAEITQVVDKDAPKNTTDITKSVNSYKHIVKGGTNTAVQLGIKLGKPVYVWDLATQSWYKWDGNRWFEETDTPTLTKNFAGIGSRDIESYNVQKDGKWLPREQYKGKKVEEAAKQAIRDVYVNTFKPTQSSTSVKEGVSELFDSNPELASIGTPEQYSEYLSTIFPNSQVKDIVYHGSGEKIEEFKDEFKATQNATIFDTPEYDKLGFFFTTDKNAADTIYAWKFDKQGNGVKTQNLNPSIINVLNPQRTKFVTDLLDAKNIDKTKDGYIAEESSEDYYIETETADGFTRELKPYQVIIVPKSEQINILGSKKDIEGFKNFVTQPPTDNLNAPDGLPGIPRTSTDCQ